MHQTSREKRSDNRKARKAVSKENATQMQKLYPNPYYWASNLEAKTNGVLKQVEQHFAEDHPLRKLIAAQSEELSAFIYAGRTEDGLPPKKRIREDLRAAKTVAVTTPPDEEIVVAEGLVDARTALVWHPTEPTEGNADD